MRVVALEMCFVAGSRVRPGTEFEFDESKCKKDAAGNPVLPKSLASIGTPVPNKAQMDLDAVKAAAGPKRGGKPGVKVTVADNVATDELL